VLVDDNNNEIDTAPKDSVHTKDTPLHRAFSCFIFNDNKELLLTKRALTKKTFPGIWSNTVCGHPGKGESAVDAARRRLKDELGLVVRDLVEISPYRYRFTDQNGTVENEICPILIGFSNDNPTPHDHEVDEWKWMKWKNFLKDLKVHSNIYSPWVREEVDILSHKTPSLLS